MYVCRGFCLPVIIVHISCKDSIQGCFKRCYNFFNLSSQEGAVGLCCENKRVCACVHSPQVVAGMSAHTHTQSWSQIVIFNFFFNFTWQFFQGDAWPLASRHFPWTPRSRCSRWTWITQLQRNKSRWCVRLSALFCFVEGKGKAEPSGRGAAWRQLNSPQRKNGSWWAAVLAD